MQDTKNHTNIDAPLVFVDVLYGGYDDIYNTCCCIPFRKILSDITITTADHSFIRFHGRNTKGHYWYNYLYSKEELKSWVQKVSQIKEQTKVLRIYFNNHYGGKAVVNALEFKEMIGMPSSEKERKALEEAKNYLSKQNS